MSEAERKLRFFVIDGHSRREVSAERLTKLAMRETENAHRSFMTMMEKDPYTGASVACDMFPDLFKAEPAEAE